MAIDAYEKTGNPKDIGSQFLTEEEKAELSAVRAGKVKKEVKKKNKK